MGIFGKNYTEHTRKYAYCKISNLEQLRNAQIKLNKDLKKKEIELGMYFDSAKELLNPITYINEFLGNIFTIQNITTYFMQGYNMAKDFITRVRHKEAEY